MGGVFMIIYDENNTNSFGMEYIKTFLNTKSRGPDDTFYNIYSNTNIHNLNQFEKIQMNKVLNRNQIRDYKRYHVILGYHRLAINGTDADCNQPFEIVSNNIVNGIRMYRKKLLVCNGEVYNYKTFGVELKSKSDVEVILTRYANSDGGEESFCDILNQINGEYATILAENIEGYDLDSTNIFVARDPYGIKPLYYITNKNGFHMFVSELKNIPKNILENTKSFMIQQVPAGHLWSFQKNRQNLKEIVFTKYYKGLDAYTDIQNCNKLTSNDELEGIYNQISDKINQSIKLRCPADEKPVGIFLSSGIGSLVISAIVIKLFRDYLDNIHFFSFNNGETGDITKFIEDQEALYNVKLNHHTINLNISIDYSNLIKCIETFDEKDVDKNSKLYWLYKYINENFKDIKIVLTGDGLNEICGGFDKYKNITCDKEYQNNLLKDLYSISKDNISSNFGIEARHPYLDCNFVEFMFSLHPKLKRANYVKKGHYVGKYIFRKAFQNSDLGIQKELLWKEHVSIHSNNSLTVKSKTDYKNFYNLFYKKRIVS